MKHRIGFNRLDRKPSNRKSLVKNMVTSLFKYERITTTKAKALAIRIFAERMITRAKEDTVHNRRVVAQRITDEGILAKLFTEIGPRYKQRPGGYTRILKLGQREGDATEMVILELVDRVVKEKATPEKAKEEKASPAKDEKAPAEKAAEAEAPKPARTRKPKAATAS